MKNYQLLILLLLLQSNILSAQYQWYQNQDGNNQPNGTYATKIESLTPNSFIACYLWRVENESYTWKISKSHINGIEQRTLFLNGITSLAEIRKGHNNAVYVLFRSFPYAQNPLYTLFKLDSNLVIKAQRTITFPGDFSIINLNAFELDDACNVYLAGDGQYPEGPGFSPASFIMKTDKYLNAKWSRMDSVQTVYSRLHIERNGTIRLIEDNPGLFPIIRVQKINASGHLLQTKQISTDAGRQSLLSIMDKNDNLLLYGIRSVNTSQAFYLIKLSRYSGNLIFKKTHFIAPGTSLDDLKQDEQGNIYTLLTQLFNSGSRCVISRINEDNGNLSWSRYFPFAQDSCMLSSIVTTGNDRLYLLGEKRSGTVFSKGFAVRMNKNGQRKENYPSPDSISFLRSHKLVQGIEDRYNRLIAVGNTNDVDTITYNSNYYRAFAIRFGYADHHTGCDAKTGNMAEEKPLEFIDEVKAEEITEEQKLAAGIVLYPNPAQNQLTVSNIDQALFDRVSIYDMCGKLISQIMIKEVTARFDVSKLSGGTYFLVLNSSVGKNNKTIKFLVRR